MSAPASAAASASATLVIPQIFTWTLMRRRQDSTSRTKAQLRFRRTGVAPVSIFSCFLWRQPRRLSYHRQTMPRTIFFDYNATTPLDPAVREAMLPFLGEVWGNPSSVHHVGQRARAALDDARDRAANFLGAKPSEVIFTSGGTESNNLAIFGAARLLKPKGKHLITSTIEHHAVLFCFDYLEKKEGFEVTRLPVDSEGRLSPEDLNQAI